MMMGFVGVLVGSTGLAPACRAGQDTASLGITASVKGNCDITGATLAFGNYVSGQPSNLDVIGLIDVANCPSGVVRLELDGGSSGNAAERRMSFGGNGLRYQLYRDFGRTLTWGTGNIGKTVNLQPTGPNRVQVFGRIPGGQNIAPGAYTDTVTITMTF